MIAYMDILKVVENNYNYIVKKKLRSVTMFRVNKKAPVSNISRTIRFTEDIFDSLMSISGKEDVSFNQLVYCTVDIYHNNQPN